MRPLIAIRTGVILGVAAFAALLLYGHARDHPEDLPWTALDLTRPVGVFTGRKIAALGPDAARCEALLGRAGVTFTVLPPRAEGQQCGYRDGVRLSQASALDIAYRPEGLGTSCRVAAALALWEWHVVQPAALAHLGSKVATI